MTDQRSILFERHRTRINDLLPTHPTFDRAARDLNDAAPTFTAAIERLAGAVNDGLRATSYEGTGGSSGDSSPVERHLIGPMGHEDTDDTWSGLPTDPAAASLAELDRMLRYLGENLRRPSVASVRLAANARTIWLIVQAWTPKPASDKQRREVTAANTAATECALTRTNLNLWAPIHCPSDLYGLLPEPVPVSRWVHRFAKDHRRLPSPMEWKHHGSTDDELRKQLIKTVR